MRALTLNRLQKLFSSGLGLHATDLYVPAGDRLVLLGPSGSGKSTLLRLIAGLETADSGEIQLESQSLCGVPPHRRPIGFLPQRPALYPHLRIREQWGSESPSLAAAIAMLQVAHLSERWPEQLSVGEKQRVALARLVARSRPVWLLDEPLAPLDPVFRAEFRHDLHLLLNAVPATMLLVTHDPNDALALGRRVGVFGEGRLQQLGTPEELASEPANRFVAMTLGRFSFLDGHISGRRVGGESAAWNFTTAEGSVVGTLPASLAPVLSDQPTPHLALGFRPEDVTLQPKSQGEFLAGFGWLVVSTEPMGSGRMLTLASGRHRLQSWWSTESPPKCGEIVRWFVDGNRILGFDASGRRLW